MSEHHGHEHDHNDANDGHGHIPGPVRSAMGLLADSLDKARNLAGPAGEKARNVSEKVREDLGKVRDDFDKVRDEGASVFDKVREEGSHVVDKLRSHGHSGPIDASNPTTGPTTGSKAAGGSDDKREKAMEVLDIAKTVGAAVLVGAVKAVQLAMREWQAHTGNASTPEDNVPKTPAASAWDTAGTPKATAFDADRDAAPGQKAAGHESGLQADEFGHDPAAQDTDQQTAPEINNWDDVEAEVADDTSWSAETDTISASPEHVEVVEVLAYTSESETPDDEADGEDGVALRAAAAPTHSGHATTDGHGHGHGHGTDDTHGTASHVHTDAPLEGFDEMTIGSLRGRLGSLSLPALEALRDYERTHTARPQVLTMLENRIAKVTAHGHEA